MSGQSEQRHKKFVKKCNNCFRSEQKFVSCGEGKECKWGKIRGKFEQIFTVFRRNVNKLNEKYLL